MTALWTFFLLHACFWLCAALFATRFIGWYPKGYRQVFLVIGLDMASVAVGQFPEVSRQLGFDLSRLPPLLFGLIPGSLFPHLLIYIISGILQFLTLGLLVRAFLDAGKAAEELRYLQRSGTDRELLKQLDAPHSPRLTSATPTADDALRGRR